MWWKKDKLSDLEKTIIEAIKEAKLPDWKLLEIDDYLNDRRFMSKYHGGHKKEKQVTYDVFVDGKKVASATGNEKDAKIEAGHYALMYTSDGKTEIKLKRKPALSNHTEGC